MRVKRCFLEAAFRISSNLWDLERAGSRPKAVALVRGRPQGHAILKHLQEVLRFSDVAGIKHGSLGAVSHAHGHAMARFGF
jgi:hypothetical protein